MRRAANFGRAKTNRVPVAEALQPACCFTRNVFKYWFISTIVKFLSFSASMKRSKISFPLGNVVLRRGNKKKREIISSFTLERQQKRRRRQEVSEKRERFRSMFQKILKKITESHLLRCSVREMDWSQTCENTSAAVSLRPFSATGQPHYTAINKKPLRFHNEIFPHGNEEEDEEEEADVP